MFSRLLAAVALAVQILGYNDQGVVSFPIYPPETVSWMAERINATRPTPTTTVTSVPVRVAPPVVSTTTTTPPAHHHHYPWTHDPRIEQWRPLVERHFNPADVERALGIIRCESVGNPQAVNPSSLTSGLMQHRREYWDNRSRQALGYVGDWFDPHHNIEVSAWLVYHGGGWRHWAGYGGYRGCLEWVIEQGA